MSDTNQNEKDVEGLNFSVDESKSEVNNSSNTSNLSEVSTVSHTSAHTSEVAKVETVNTTNTMNTNKTDLTEKKEEKMEEKKEKSLKLLGSNNRVLPALIEDLLTKNIPIILDKEGYLIGGFYGAEVEGRKDVGLGFIMLKDADQEGTFIAFDHKGKKHQVHTFHDLVVLNNNVWRGFYKQTEFRRAHPLWFDFMYEYGVLEIVPGKF